jgi:signal transduction histidine kinase
VFSTLVPLRWIGLAHLLVVLGYDMDVAQRPGTGWLVLGAACATTVAITAIARRRPQLLAHPLVLALELVVALGLQLADGWIFGPDHTGQFAAPAGIWALGAVMSVGVAWGAPAGAAAGIAAALARFVGSWAPDLETRAAFLRPPEPPRFLPLITALVLYALAGAGAGYLTRRLERAEDAIAELRARQRLQATLHDGVLQSLAYITRRAADPDIARVARDADIELRAHLNTSPASELDTDLATIITHAARRAEHHLECPLRLAIDPELPPRDPGVIAAVTGAVTEAITNAAKHAEASRVTVYAAPAEPDGITVTITDNGRGFDPERVPPGGGLDQSLRARIRAINGSITIRSEPDAGTEVELWIP